MSLPTESLYDPTENVRYEPDESPEEIETRQIEEADTRRKLGVLYETRSAFIADGWKHIEATLEQVAAAINNQLVSGASHDPQDDAFKRGQLKTIQWMRDWPSRLDEEIDGIKEQIAD